MPLFSNTRSSFLIGSLFGFFVGSTLFSGLSLHVFSEEPNHPIEVTTHALRQLASLRHFPQDNGWGLLHVFHGDNHSRLSQPEPSSMWPGQDFLIRNVWKSKQNGFYVDIGAGHAFHSSKTYPLEAQYGWKGICVEADPAHWEGLSFRKCDVVGAIVAETTSKVETGINARATIHSETRLHHAVPLREILERFEAPRVIDFLSLRGHYAVFNDFPFDRYRFNVVVVENQSAEETATTLVSNEYIEVTLLPNSSRIWIHRSIQHTIDFQAVSTESLRLAKKFNDLQSTVDRS